MRTGDVVIIGFWVKQESTEKWREVLEKKGEWKEEIFMSSALPFGKEGHTYLSFYKERRPKSWIPVLAKII